jgi:hypothetical protein
MKRTATTNAENAEETTAGYAESGRVVCERASAQQLDQSSESKKAILLFSVLSVFSGACVCVISGRGSSARPQRSWLF